MTPEERAQFEELQRRVQNLERVENVDFVGNLEDRQIVRPDTFDATGITGVSNANDNLRDTTVTIPLGGGSGTVTHLEAPDNFLEYQYKGKVYKLWANDL